MNKQELSEFFTECLRSELIYKKYNGGEICDVDVNISNYSWENEDGGGDFNRIDIKVKTLSKSGKTSKWEEYYIS